MNIKAYSEAFLHAAIFEGIETDDCFRIIACAGGYMRAYTDGEIILSAGEEVPAFGIVSEGCIEAARQTASGRRIIITRMEQSGMFGEVLACAAERKSPVTITARDGAKILYLSYERLSACCDNACPCHVRVIRNLLKIIADKYFELNSRLTFLANKGVREKAAGFLIGQSENAESGFFSIGMNREVMADYLNTDRSALSRELGRMKKEGFIDYYKDSFKITDLEGLKKYT